MVFRSSSGGNCGEAGFGMELQVGCSLQGGIVQYVSQWNWSYCIGLLRSWFAIFFFFFIAARSA